MSQRNRPLMWSLVCLLLTAAASWAAVVPDRSSSVGEKELRHSDLDIANAFQPPHRLPPQAAALAAADLAGLGLPADRGRLDVRGGRWASVIASEPVVPGRGVGNALTWRHLGQPPPADDRAFAKAAWDAVRGYLQSNASHLRIDVGELAVTPRVIVHRNGALIQIHAPRAIDGIRVRDSYLTVVVGQGNVVLLGTHRWGDIDVSTVPGVPAEAGLAAVRAHVDPYPITGAWGKSELAILPLARGRDPSRIPIGRGYDHRLVWVIRPSFADDLGRWEALVDAASGELLSFEDTHHYAEVRGGVLPVSNDGVLPDGVEQAGWPLPFDILQTSGGPATTDAGGNIPGSVTGSRTSNLAGQFIRMNDNCGAISLTTAGDLDFGTSGGTDCVTPGFGGAGNTHASRTGFHELNRISEMGRGQLPGNLWLQQQLTSNMNINSTCNAFWNGATVNFYRSGGGCANTGELAGIFDHEWGHGMDANDATPGVSNPGEGIADIYAALRLNDSCIGRNFRPGVPCGGYGDPCLDCTGVRDIDFANRQSGQPHDVTWAIAVCGSIVHCRGYVYSEAVWDLWHRDLTAAPYNMDNNTALEVTARLTYLGAGGVGTWYTNDPPFGGCSATGGYLQYLAADDDDGDTSNGTPHMTAIFNAFNRHQAACDTPTVQDSGCASLPTVAPTLSASGLDKAMSLSWNVVADASKYQVFRTDGVFACDFGKIKVGETAGTSFTDHGLQNGRDYSYVVIPIGSADTCMGPASGCVTDAPVSGPNLDIDADSAVLTLTGSDGDEFLDNCERGPMTFDVINSGLGTLTHARIVDVTSPSHPAITFETSFPSAVSPSTLAEGATGVASFDFRAAGLSPDDTVVFRVEATADEMTVSKLQDLAVGAVESDFQSFASRTFGFEADDESWSVEQGSFVRSSAWGGGDGTAWAQESSNGLHNQCDRMRSPLMRLQATSSLTLWNNFDIEPLSFLTWYDRANVGILDEGGARTLITPDGGRLYNADSSGPGNYFGCNEPEEGWAGTQATWTPATGRRRRCKRRPSPASGSGWR